VRLAKSRTTAQKLVEEGRVRINREKADAASRLVRPGDVLTIRLEREVRILKVLDPGTRRGPASEAQTLYEDLTDRSEPADRSAGGARPTKRDRREMEAFRADRETGGRSFPDGGDD